MIRLESGKFFGETARHGRFGEFTVTASRYRAGERLPRHCHENAYLFVMTSGGMMERLLGRDNECTRGWLIFNEAGESHDDHVFEHGAEGLNIEMSPRWLADLREGIGAHDPVVCQHSGPAITAIGLLQLAIGRRDRLERLRVEEAVIVLLDSLSRPAPVRGRQPAWLGIVEELVRSQVRGDLSFEDISTAAGVHPAHLCREFRRTFGCTVSQYASRLRADMALQLVLEGDMALSTVAAQAGFADQAHLTRTLQRQFGATPGQLRRERRNPN